MTRQIGQEQQQLEMAELLLSAPNKTIFVATMREDFYDKSLAFIDDYRQYIQSKMDYAKSEFKNL